MHTMLQRLIFSIKKDANEYIMSNWHIEKVKYFINKLNKQYQLEKKKYFIIPMFV